MEALTKFEDWFTPHRRKVVYRTANAVTLVLVVHNVINQDEAAVYLLAIAGVLGMADRNVDMGTVETEPHYTSNDETPEA
jgi:hypothetical protein